MPISDTSIKTNSQNKMSSHDLELSTLVGRDLLILSNQLDKKSMYAKVVMVNDNSISIDKGGEDNSLCDIENDQEIIVQFDYKSQRVSAKAKIFKSSSGRANIVLDENVIPLNRRMFKRYEHNVMVRCAILPVQRIIDSNLSKLRWLQVEAINISSGGLLLPVPSKITDNTYLLLNIAYENPYLPSLVIGQVRHTNSINSFNYHVGVQFIISENRENYFSPLVLKKIPTKALKYTIKNRNRFDKFLFENLSQIEE